MKVTIMQYRMFHYRIALFEEMRKLASTRGISLYVVYGQPSSAEIGKRDTGELSWGVYGRNWYLPIKEKKDLCWQKMPAQLRNSDMVIFMQENRLLSNYYWIIRRKLGGPKIAFWGHGRDFQSNAPGGFREIWKEKLIKAVDWWFAYTQITVDVLLQAGFPGNRITCLNNSIDTVGLKRDAARVATATLDNLRQYLDLQTDGTLGLFCGSLYPDKKLELLIDACDCVVQYCPKFRLVVLGDGTCRDWLLSALATRSWAHWVGVKRGVEKAAYFRLSKFVLNPGLVGLHVLDAFALGLPMITTAGAKHSPEIAYLEHDVNGLICDDTAESFARAVCQLINDSSRYERMSAAAYASGQKYSIEKMAQHFVSGISACLSAK